MARILDGAAFAAAIKQEVAEEVGRLTARGVRPGKFYFRRGGPFDRSESS